MYRKLSEHYAKMCELNAQERELDEKIRDAESVDYESYEDFVNAVGKCEMEMRLLYMKKNVEGLEFIKDVNENAPGFLDAEYYVCYESSQENNTTTCYDKIQVFNDEEFTILMPLMEKENREELHAFLKDHIVEQIEFNGDDYEFVDHGSPIKEIYYGSIDDVACQLSKWNGVLPEEELVKLREAFVELDGIDKLMNIDDIDPNYADLYFDLSGHVEISEEKLSAFSQYLDWKGVSKMQKMSEEFMLEHKNDVYWSEISKRSDINPEFVKKAVADYNKSLQQELIDAMMNKEYYTVVDNIVSDIKDWSCLTQDTIKLTTIAEGYMSNSRSFEEAQNDYSFKLIKALEDVHSEKAFDDAMAKLECVENAHLLTADAITKLGSKMQELGIEKTIGFDGPTGPELC